MQKYTLYIAALSLFVCMGCADDSSSGDNENVSMRTGDVGGGEEPGTEGSSDSDANGVEQLATDVEDVDGECETDCNDGLYCTIDECKDGDCVHTLDGDSCLAEGICYGVFELDPNDQCQLCDPVGSGGWGPVPDDQINCDDGDVCTLDDMCAGGVCVGEDFPCDDGDICTDDSCVSETGEPECVYTANTASCDDFDLCTIDDICEQFNCAGDDKCDDGDPCTQDACTVDGVCEYAPVICDDGNDCTENSCDPALGGCQFVPTEDGTLCEGLNFCVSGDSCVAGVCVDGVNPVTCDTDDNPCTDNACQPMVGCVAFFNNDPCDDGFSCTVNDSCNASVCSGTPTPACEGCTEFVTQGVTLKATVMLVGEDGFPGDGLDVDGDPTTCAPLNCSDGIDNALGDLAVVLNPILTQSIFTGDNAPIIELRNENGNDVPFDVAMYNGVAKKFGEECDFLAEVCEYELIPGSLLPDCSPTMFLEDVVLEGNKLVGGGPSTILTMGLPLSPGEIHYVVIVGGRVDATVEFAEDGKTIIGLEGIVAGAIPKDALIDSLGNVDPSLFGGSGLSVEGFIELVEALVEEDIDLDGNGENDAASIGIQITAIPGIVTGIQGQ